VYVAQSVRAVDNLKTILAPTLCVPHTAQKLHEYLGYEGQLFGTQHVIEYQEETRSHRALPYDHTGALGTWASSTLPPGHTSLAPLAGVAGAGAALQEAGRESDRRGVCAVGGLGKRNV
jgi:hypothetical protein